MEIYSKIYSLFGWLADFYGLDYFVENHWSQMPKSWQNYFQKCLEICEESEQLFGQLIEVITNYNSLYFGRQFYVIFFKLLMV